ncbi:MAG: hypothetical protein AABW80_00300 [Nanoarchaeota archaeon]
MKEDSVKILLKQIVASISGTASIGLVDLLYGKKNVNEFLIAKKLNMTINQTRNILYKLADEGLVSFVRKKDSKKGGWYTYFWTLNSGKSLARFNGKLSEELQKLKSHLENRRAGRFYYSPSADLEYTEEQALINDYTCPETGEVLVLKDTNSEVKELEKQVVKLEGFLENVRNELGMISNKEEKALNRKLKAEAKKKMNERAKKRAENKKERDKLKPKVKKVNSGKKSKNKKKRL